MRIIAGRFGGRRLASVGKGDSAAHLRPTSDRVRESLFSMLMHLDVIEGAQVLDLFAGTGALGLEALSRGADHVTFVEQGRTSCGLIADNIRMLGAGSESKLIRRNALSFGSCDGPPCDLVFLDPPYGKGLGEKALIGANAQGWIAPGACVIWEDNAVMSAPDGFAVQDHRTYGGTHVTVLRAKS